MTKTVVIASNNAHKADEIRNALNFEDWEFLTLKELGIESDPDEDADTFEGNARIKALAAHKASGGLAALADDSGLVVDALGGAPGVYSSRYAGEHGNDADNNAKLLLELAHVPLEKRSARFMCCLVFIDENDCETVAVGSVEGRIGYELIGEEGFGYDPLFYPEALDGERTFAEISQAEKSELSHRGRALRALKDKLA